MRKKILTFVGMVALSVAYSGSAVGQGNGNHSDHGQGHEKGNGNGQGHHNHGQDEQDNHGRDHKGHWNPAPPKKNGRHDNRNWNKAHNDDWNGGRRSNVTGAFSNDPRLIDRRQQTKNEWRNLATAGGLVSILGLLTHEKTLVFAGAAGGLYSLYRYEEDRKSQSKLARGRAYYFSQPYFVRDGQRFNRRTVVQNGQRYYQFARG